VVLTNKVFVNNIGKKEGGLSKREEVEGIEARKGNRDPIA
jgi:hypothetical protein